MSVLLRLAGPVALGAAALLLVLLVLLPWMGGPALLGDDLGSLCRDYFEASTNGAALTARDRALQGHLQAKAAVCGEVIDGHLSLAEAAGRFRGLRGAIDDGQEDVLGPLRLDSAEGEELYRQVVAWVTMQLRDRPERREEVLARLEREREELAVVTR